MAQEPNAPPGGLQISTQLRSVRERLDGAGGLVEDERARAERQIQNMVAEESGAPLPGRKTSELPGPTSKVSDADALMNAWKTQMQWQINRLKAKKAPSNEWQAFQEAFEGRQPLLDSWLQEAIAQARREIDLASS